MGSPCLFTCWRALKMGYFYWLCIKSLNHLHTNLNLGYPKDTKFYLESKASFIYISSIASFKLFLIVWLWEYCTFSDSSMVSQKSLPWPKYTHLGTIFQKKIAFHYQTSFFFKHVLYYTVLSKYMIKNRGSLCLFKRKGEFISPSSLA